MDCDTIRAAISTQIDGEAPWLPADALETHLAGCPDCRDWQRRAHTVTRRVRLGGAFLDHDLAPGVLAAVPVARDRGRLRLARRGLLIVLALAQFAIAAPMLLLGHDHDAGAHAAHELGSFNLALAIAFAVGAIRPKLSAGLAWPCAIAAAGLVATAVIDLIGGQAIGADEAQHLVALAGARAARVAGSSDRHRHRGRRHAPGESPTVTRPAVRADRSRPVDGAPDHSQGGDAARLTVPDVAAGRCREGRRPDPATAQSASGRPRPTGATQARRQRDGRPPRTRSGSTPTARRSHDARGADRRTADGTAGAIAPTGPAMAAAGRHPRRRAGDRGHDLRGLRGADREEAEQAGRTCARR